MCHAAYLSVRFSSRYGMLLNRYARCCAIRSSFSPLFIAVWNVTGQELEQDTPTITTFSPLFIAVWNVTAIKTVKSWARTTTFSPLFIAVWNVTEIWNWPQRNSIPFSPLFIAVWNVTTRGSYPQFVDNLLSVRFSSRYGMLLRNT